jgi:hypothetical protein
MSVAVDAVVQAAATVGVKPERVEALLNLTAARDAQKALEGATRVVRH